MHKLVVLEVFVLWLSSCSTAQAALEAFARPLTASGTGLPGWCWLCSAGKDVFLPTVLCLDGWL